MISVLSVRRVQKHLVLVGDCLHSHTVQMVLLAITFRYYLKELHHGCTGCISLTLDGVSICLIAEITLLFGQLNLRKDFWEELNAYYYSGDLQIATSCRILFLTFSGNVFSLIGILQ